MIVPTICAIVILVVIGLASRLIAKLWDKRIEGKAAIAKPALIKAPDGGPYRVGSITEPVETEVPLEQLPDPGSLTATQALAEFKTQEMKRHANIAEFFNTKVEQKIRNAISEGERKVYIFRLSEGDVEALASYAKKLGYGVKEKNVDFLVITF